MTTEKTSAQVSRRKFLKQAAVAAPGIAAATASGAHVQTASTIPPKWDRETDVIAIGTGFAGLATAITVKDAGAKALILGKMPQEHEGGNSRVSGNMW
jgi:heterodisulfide reductase subunit A-like polyferredoxin